MCDDRDDERQARAAHGDTTRRSFIGGGLAALAGGVLLPQPALARTTLSGLPVIRVAHHVHASGSEHGASWEQQYMRATQAGMHVICMTDHDHQLLAAPFFATHLRGDWQAATIGAASVSRAALAADGSAHLACTASTSSGATTTLTITDRNAWSTIRTLLRGVTLTLTFGVNDLPHGAYVDLVVTGSLHPAQAGRPEGAYAVRYRYGADLTAGTRLADGGLTQLVTAPLPGTGTPVVLDPAVDMAHAWPDMLADDQGFQWLALQVHSTGPDCAATANVQSVQIDFGDRSPTSLTATLNGIRSWAQGRYPTLTGYVSQEISSGPNEVPHVNPLFVPLDLRDKPGMNVGNWRSYYRPQMAAALAAGAAITWNHVFGPGVGALSASQQTALRRATWRARAADDWLGATCLEVYTVRGGMGMDQFLAIADTCYRNGRAMTLVGANDDHVGNVDWRTLGNGWATGAYAASRSRAHLAHAFNTGRCFAYHCGRWPGAALDTTVNGALMGHSTRRTGATAAVTLLADNLPPRSVVQIVVGAVDHGAPDPSTAVVRTVAAASFVSGTVGTSVPVPPGACFVRPQVRASNGTIIGVGQPTFLT